MLLQFHTHAHIHTQTHSNPHTNTQAHSNPHTDAHLHYKDYTSDIETSVSNLSAFSRRGTWKDNALSAPFSFASSVSLYVICVCVCACKPCAAYADDHSHLPNEIILRGWDLEQISSRVDLLYNTLCRERWIQSNFPLVLIHPAQFPWKKIRELNRNPISSVSSASFFFFLHTH